MRMWARRRTWDTLQLAWTGLPVMLLGDSLAAVVQRVAAGAVLMKAWEQVASAKQMDHVVLPSDV